MKRYTHECFNVNRYGKGSKLESCCEVISDKYNHPFQTRNEFMTHFQLNYFKETYIHEIMEVVSITLEVTIRPEVASIKRETALILF